MHGTGVSEVCGSVVLWSAVPNMTDDVWSPPAPSSDATVSPCRVDGPSPPMATATSWWVAPDAVDGVDRDCSLVGGGFTPSGSLGLSAARRTPPVTGTDELSDPLTGGGWVGLAPVITISPALRPSNPSADDELEPSPCGLATSPNTPTASTDTEDAATVSLAPALESRPLRNVPRPPLYASSPTATGAAATPAYERNPAHTSRSSSCGDWHDEQVSRCARTPRFSPPFVVPAG